MLPGAEGWDRRLRLAILRPLAVLLELTTSSAVNPEHKDGELDYLST